MSFFVFALDWAQHQDFLQNFQFLKVPVTILKKPYIRVIFS